MPSIELSREERITIERFVEQTPSRKEGVRGKAILELADGGTVDHVAECHDVTRQTVYNWIRQFTMRGDQDPIDRLRTGALGRPKKCREPIEPILEVAMTCDPRSLGYESVFWSTSLLMLHLREHHGIEATRTCVELAIHRIRPLRAVQPAPSSHRSGQE